MGRYLRTGTLAVLVTAIPCQLVSAQAQQAEQARPSFRDDRRWLPKPADKSPETTASSSSNAGPTGAMPPPTLTPSAPHVAASAQPTKSGCPQATLKATALEAGRMHVALTSPCRAEQDFSWSYGGADLAAAFDKSGRAEITVDCFVGAATPVIVKFQDEMTIEAPVQALDLDKVSKVALIWSAPVNLDLHIFEYAALPGSPGHVSASAPRSLVMAREFMEKTARGHGFMSSIATHSGRGDHLEVFTFLHREQQGFGALSLAIDNETRGSTPAESHCSTGSFAEIPFKIVHWSRRGNATRESGLIASVPCGTPIATTDRLSALTTPVFKARW